MRNLATTAILALFILSGCASSNPERSEQSQEVISTLNTAQEQLNRLASQLDETEMSLENISNLNDSNVEEEYNSFSNHLSTLSDVKDEFNDIMDELRSNTNDYISNLQDEARGFDNEQLRRSSEDRRQELNEVFNEILTNGGDTSRMLEKYISDANEIETYLSSDLSSRGAQSVSSSRESVMDTGEELRETIYRMQQSIAQAKQEMGSNISTE